MFGPMWLEEPQDHLEGGKKDGNADYKLGSDLCWSCRLKKSIVFLVGLLIYLLIRNIILGLKGFILYRLLVGIILGLKGLILHCLLVGRVLRLLMSG